MEEQALAKAREWAQNPYFDDESRKEIQDLLDSKNTTEIVDRFYRDLEFGTGGLRSIMGMGCNRMSKYTVRKATQALANTLLQSFSKRPLRVAISYDSRKNSLSFAQEAAQVLAGNGIEAFIFKRLNPTPLLSFAVRFTNSQAGIMVTASHNPPSYNGYKAYWSTGGQVIPPYDEEIISAYNKLQDFGQIRFMEFESAEKKGLIHWMGEEVEEAYQKEILKFTFNRKLCQEKGDQLKIIYTPIHGTGYIPCTEILKAQGLNNLHLVESQVKPDSRFPTVKSPNPEDPEALTLAVELLKKEKGDIAYGTDPDSDRLGVVVNHHGEIVFLNGNQVAVLLLHYMLHHYKQLGQIDKNSLVIKSIVTSEMQQAVADSFGVPLYNTLTGFKWMCGLYDQMIEKDPQLKMLFASEESYGYLVHDLIRDKDAVSALLVTSEMALWYKMKGMTLVDALDKLYEELGFYHEGLLSLNFLGKEGADKINRIMEYLRYYSGKEFVGEEIVMMDDYQELCAVNWNTKEKRSLSFPVRSNVLGFTMKSGDKIFLRPSGTEPKIKFYFLVQEKQGSLKEKKDRAYAKVKKFDQFFRDISQKV